MLIHPTPIKTLCLKGTLMNTLLYDLAVESGEIEAHEGNPEELTIITDDSESELEEVVEQLAEDVEKVEDQDNAAEKMIDVIESLESKITMLRDMRERGENLNATAAKIYSSSLVTSLEARGFPSALFADEVVEMNTSFESSNAYDYSTEAEEKSEGILAKIKNMLKAAFKSFMEWAGRLAESTKILGRSLITLGAKLVKAVDANGKSTPLTAENSKIGSKGLESVGEDPVAALKQLKSADGKLNSFTNTILSDFGKQASVFKVDSDKEFNVIDFVSLPTAAGRELTATGADGKLAYSIKKSDVTTKPEFDVLPLDKIKAVGKGLSDLGTTLELSSKLTVSHIKKLEDETKTVYKILDKMSTAKAPSVLLKALNNTAKDVRSLRSLFNKEAASVGKSAYRYGVRSLAKYK